LRSVTGLDRCNECNEIGRQNGKAPVSWLILSVRGLVALFLGVSVLIASWGQDRLATFIGVYFILAGAQALRYAGAASARSRVRIRRVAGIIAIVFAVLVITRETLAGAIPQHLVLTLLGLATIAIGLMRLAGGFSEEDPRATDQAWRRPPVTDVGLGIAELVLGVALIVGDRGGIRPAVAVWGLVSGTALLVDARRARRDRTQPPGGAGAQTDGVGLR
jgi:uncharacterized membrane protein HdeD (DUF308 family)